MAVLGTVYGDDKVEAALRRMPSLLRRALEQAMRIQWFALQRYIITSKLSGQVLRRRTGNLASSINAGAAGSASEFVSEGDTIVGRVGTKVWYGAVHEYGGDFSVPAHQRMQTQVFGRPVTPHLVDVRSYTAHFPERSFLRSGLNDKSTQIRDAIARSVREQMDNLR